MTNEHRAQSPRRSRTCLPAVLRRSLLRLPLVLARPSRAPTTIATPRACQAQSPLPRSPRRGPCRDRASLAISPVLIESTKRKKPRNIRQRPSVCAGGDRDQTPITQVPHLCSCLLTMVIFVRSQFYTACIIMLPFYYLYN